VPLDKTIARIAKTYFAALKDGVEPALMEGFGILSEIILTEHETQRVVDTIAQRAGQADDPALRKVLSMMRQQFEQQMYKSEVSRLRAIFHRDREHGWTAWQAALGDALVKWSTRLVEMLIREAFPFPERVEDDLARIRRLARYLIQERYEEGYELFTYLAEQEAISPVVRSKLYVIAAEVQCYRFAELEAGKRLMQHAEELAPDEILVKCGWAVYWLQKSNITEAKKYLERALKQGEGGPVEQTYILMGDCYDKQEDYDTAEAWYREATKQADTSAASGYTSLVTLYSRTKELFQSHEAEFESLLQRAIAVDPTIAYMGCLRISAAYQGYQQFKQAHAWCERAIQSDVSRVDGYVLNGRVYSDEGRFYRENKQDDEAEAAFKQAEAAFQRVIEIDPTIWDAYWYLGELRETQERWQEAFDLYEKSLPFRPMFEQTIRLKMGDMLWQQGRYEEAVDEGIKALRLKPDEQAPLDRLETWADDFYKKLDKPSDAQHLYDIIRQIVGPSYEAAYQNRLGNLEYYQGNYQAAVEYYDKAIAADPDDPVYFSNSAYAWKQIKLPGKYLMALEKAMIALREACRLAPKDSSYAERLAELEGQARQLRLFGEYILNLVPEGTLIIVELGEQLVDTFATPERDLAPEVQEAVNAMRQHGLENYGIRIPGITFKDNSDLPGDGYVLKVPGTAPAKGTMPPGKRFCERSSSELAQLTITAEADADGYGCWVAKQDWSKVEESGLPLWREIDYLLRHLARILALNLPTLADHRQIDVMLEEKRVPTAEQFRNNPRLFTTLVLALKALLAEYVSIARLEEIAQAFLKQFENGQDIMSTVEHLRSLLSPFLPGSGPAYHYIAFDQGLEALLASHIYQTRYGQVMAMQFSDFYRIMQAINEALEDRADRVLLVSDSQLRPLVKAMIGTIFSRTQVLCKDEMTGDWKERVIGEIVKTETEQASVNGFVEKGESVQGREEQHWQSQFANGNSEPDVGETEKKEGQGRITRKLPDTYTAGQDAEPITVYFPPWLYREVVPDAEQENQQGASGTAIESWVDTLQSTVYEDIGLLIPLLQFAMDDQLPHNEARVEPGGKRLPLILATQNEEDESKKDKSETGSDSKPLAMRTAADILNYIEANARDFLTVDSLQCCLAILSQSFPALVKSVLARFDYAMLTEFLKDLLDRHQPIKDLRTILEELVLINGTIQIDAEKHLPIPAGFFLKAPVEDNRTLIFFPFTARLCFITEGKPLEGLEAKDYADYLSMLLAKNSS
jgi:tetratricopeptide (TPR) repeat protein